MTFIDIATILFAVVFVAITGLLVYVTWTEYRYRRDIDEANRLFDITDYDD